jgi:hypothetical protein
VISRIPTGDLSRKPYEEFRIGDRTVHPAWLDGLRTVVQPVAGALPAFAVVLFAGLLALLGLLCGSGGRSYALDYADRLVDLAAVVVGARRTRRSGESQARASRRPAA